MPLTDRYTPVIDFHVDTLRRPVNLDKLRIPDNDPSYIYYGDRQLIPATPAISVVPGPYTRSISGVGGKGRTDNNIRVFFLCYIARLDDSSELARDVDLFGETLMDILHENVTLGGLVVHGFVTAIEPGYATRSGTYMHACRVTWEGLTKTFIN